MSREQSGTQELTIHTSVLTLSLAAGAALVLSASAGTSGDHEGGHDDGFAVGQPANNAEPDRTTEIDANDARKFRPGRIEVKDGEVIHFVIRHTGAFQRSFTPGSRKWHQRHAEKMKGILINKLSRHRRGKPKGVVVPPGETRAFNWRIQNGAAVQFGCHVPGHFPAGMKGAIDIG